VDLLSFHAAKRKTIALLPLLLFVACTTAPVKKPPVVAGQDAHRDMARIQAQLNVGDYNRAVPNLKKLIATYPGTDTAVDATLVLGRIYYNTKNYNAAYQTYISIVNSNIVTPNEGQALLGAARALAKLGKLDESLALTDRGIRSEGGSDKLILDLYRLRISILTDLGDRIDALRAAVFLSNKETDAAARESARNRAVDLIESRLSERELDTVAHDQGFDWARSYAYFRLGAIAYDNHDFSRARDAYQSIIALFPTSELAEQARARVNQIDARRQVDAFTVGAVLPLSGKYASIGARTLRGLELGLGIYGADRSDFRLAVVDEEGTADSARRAVERLVTENHVVAVVGSLLSKTAVAVASKADELGVPSIGLSQKVGLTDVGPSVFRNAMTSQIQVHELVHQAMDVLGLRKFAMLYPNDAYGTEFANLFWDEVLSRGGQINAAQVYDPNETDFSPHVERLVGRFYLEDREEEYRHLLKELAKKQKGISSRKSIPDDLLPPIVQFQALFVPDSAKALGQIAPMLAYQDIKDVRLLGTNLWNTDALVARGERHVEKAVFLDGLFSQDEEFRNSRFFKEFKRVFGEEPGLFDVQGYDTGLILRQIIASGERSRVGLIERLGQLRDFPGALGNLNMTPQREIYRPLVPLTVESGKIVRFTTATLQK
jgi:ABC-type branched-subunit amino acid transport system substrate-binding protein